MLIRNMKIVGSGSCLVFFYLLLPPSLLFLYFICCIYDRRKGITKWYEVCKTDIIGQENIICDVPEFFSEIGW